MEASFNCLTRKPLKNTSYRNTFVTIESALSSDSYACTTFREYKELGWRGPLNTHSFIAIIRIGANKCNAKSNRAAPTTCTAVGYVGSAQAYMKSNLCLYHQDRSKRPVGRMGIAALFVLWGVITNVVETRAAEWTSTTLVIVARASTKECLYQIWCTLLLLHTTAFHCAWVFGCFLVHTYTIYERAKTQHRGGAKCGDNGRVAPCPFKSATVFLSVRKVPFHSLMIHGYLESLRLFANL